MSNQFKVHESNDSQDRRMSVMESLSFLNIRLKVISYLNQVESAEVSDSQFRSCNEFTMGGINPATKLLNSSYEETNPQTSRSNWIFLDTKYLNIYGNPYLLPLNGNSQEKKEQAKLD